MQAHIMSLAFVNKLGIFHFNDRFNFIDVVIASHQSYNVVRIECHVFIREVVSVLASFDTDYADLVLTT